ncbi:MAG: hypothetical protein ABR498_02120 [Candidatus Dormibacteria bacterium]
MSTVAEASPRWRVHLGTASSTCVRLRLPTRDDHAPWPLSRVVAELQAMGCARDDRPHALGAGRGMPLIHRQALRWRDMPLHLESHHVGGRDEVSLELPSGDELIDLIDEDALWDMVDRVAAACDASHGAVGDGEALEDGPPALRRHVGVLIPAHTLEVRASPYTQLPMSGLAVLLR